MFLDIYRPFQKRERMNSSHLSFICWVSVKTDSRPARVPACVNKQWSDKNRSVLPSERHFRRRNRHSCVWGEREKKKKTHRHLKLLACLQPRAVPSLRMCCYLFVCRPSVHLIPPSLAPISTINGLWVTGVLASCPMHKSLVGGFAMPSKDNPTILVLLNLQSIVCCRHTLWFTACHWSCNNNLINQYWEK